MDKKFVYISKTLSRTKRKDYENYVINAIWNRLDRPDIKPVSQQYIMRSTNKRYFIDLYFPQLNIGVECDEGYHGGRVAEDLARELTIFDILSKVDDVNTYKALHIDVSKSYEEIERQINECVRKIKELIKIKESKGTLGEWRDENPAIYFQNRDRITTKDDVTFRTSIEACNTLFSTDYSWGVIINGKIPNTFQRVGWDRMVWFPLLAVEGRAIKAGWNNQLSSDGNRIYEYNEVLTRDELESNIASDHRDKLERVTFVKSRDPITHISSFRFVGIFKVVGWEGNKKVHEKIGDECELIRLNH